MNAYELFEAMDGIDDEILERSELQRKNPLRFLRPGLIAACCVLVLSLMYAQLRYGIWHPAHPVDPTQETTEIPRQVVDKPYYNQEHILLVMQERLYYTIHQLSEAEIAKVLPERLAPWMRFSADATAYHEDDREGIVNIWLSTPTSMENVSLEVVLGHYQQSVGYGDDAVVYRCGQVDYILTLGDYTDTMQHWHLGAFAEIQGVPVYLEMDAPEDQLEAAKTVFEEALVCFSGYEENSLDIQIWNSEVLPDYIYPHSWYIESSRYRLERDTHYSIYLPEEDSKVFTSEEITWDSGDFTRIAVSCYKGKKLVLEWNIYEGEQLMPYGAILYSDLGECIEIQDLTLNIVQQYVKKRYEYLCVGYDDIIISVCPRDVSAQWLYDQLIGVRERVRQSAIDYKMYLPPEGSELWTEASVQKQWIYGTFMNLSMQCFRDGQLVLDWSVGDSRLAEGVGPLIEAEELTQEMLENCVEPDGKIYADILFDDVWVSIDAQGIPTQWLYEQLIAVRERVGLNALNRFQDILRQPDLEELCLEIYYLDLDILTYLPMDTENLKVNTLTETISVDTQTLLEHMELLKRLDTSVVKPAEDLGHVNARMCYVFETADGEEVLEVVINGPKDRIYVNGVQVEHDLVFLEVIEPFITEDLREAWQWDLDSWK